MSVRVEKDVVWFEIPVNILHFVHRIESQQNLSGVELGLLVGENVLLHEQVHEVSTGQVLHNEVEVIAVLEGTFEGHHPWVLL